MALWPSATEPARFKVWKEGALSPPGAVRAGEYSLGLSPTKKEHNLSPWTHKDFTLGLGPSSHKRLT